jgi:hypothetical protein
MDKESLDYFKANTRVVQDNSGLFNALFTTVEGESIVIAKASTKKEALAKAEINILKVIENFKKSGGKIDSEKR